MAKTFVQVFGSGGEFVPPAGGGGFGLTGTPVAIAWATGATPAAQNISIPADCTAVYMFWRYFNSSNAQLSAATLNGNTWSEALNQIGGPAADGRGVVAWYSPPTGTQALQVTWANAPDNDDTMTMVVFVRGGNVTAWRDADQLFVSDVGPVSRQLTTVAGDLVLKADTLVGGTPPSLSAGWSSGVTQVHNGLASRLSYITATGTTQNCDSEDEFYSTIICVAIPVL